jgi:hypothetical protein
MAVCSVHDYSEDDHVARTEVRLIIAVMLIASLPFILGMVVWLPGVLEQFGLAVAQAARF